VWGICKNAMLIQAKYDRYSQLRAHHDKKNKKMICKEEASA
jgi:hypothetical protein